MSLQDDIFDVQAFLETKADASTQRAFERIYSSLAELEKANTIMRRKLAALEDGAKALRELFKGA